MKRVICSTGEDLIADGMRDDMITDMQAVAASVRLVEKQISGIKKMANKYFEEGANIPNNIISQLDTASSCIQNASNQLVDILSEDYLR